MSKRISSGILLALALSCAGWLYGFNRERVRFRQGWDGRGGSRSESHPDEHVYQRADHGDFRCQWRIPVSPTGSVHLRAGRGVEGI